jgi:hypothetical protein
LVPLDRQSGAEAVLSSSCWLPDGRFAGGSLRARRRRVGFIEQVGIEQVLLPQSAPKRNKPPPSTHSLVSSFTSSPHAAGHAPLYSIVRLSATRVKVPKVPVRQQGRIPVVSGATRLPYLGAGLSETEAGEITSEPPAWLSIA